MSYFGRVLPGEPTPPARPNADVERPVPIDHEVFVDAPAMSAPSTPHVDAPPPPDVGREIATPAPSLPTPTPRAPSPRVERVPPPSPPTHRPIASRATPPREPAARTPSTPVPIEHEQVIETAAPSPTPTPPAPGRGVELLREVRRWIATPPPPRTQPPPTPRAIEPAIARHEIEVDVERDAADPTPPPLWRGRTEPRAPSTASREPIEISIGSIEVTVDDPAARARNAAAARATTPSPRGARATFGRGWLQRRFVRV